MAYNIYNSPNVGFYNSQDEYDYGDERAPGGPVRWRGFRGRNSGMNNQYRENQRQYQQQMEEPPPQLQHLSPLLRLRQPRSLQPMSEPKHQFLPQEEELSPTLQQLRQPKLQQSSPPFHHSSSMIQQPLSPVERPLRRIQPSPQLQLSSLPKEYIPPMEQLRQPRLQQSSPKRQSLPGQQQSSPQQVPPVSPQLSPACDTVSKDLQQGKKEQEMLTDISDAVKKTADNSNSQNPPGNIIGVKVKKLTKREWRRRQNMHLRRILTPKNALIVLNEMLPGEKGVGQFKVEPAPPQPSHAANAHLFRAELTVDGVTYMGYGHSKLSARNDVAEQVFRDLILKHMLKLQRGCEPSSGSVKSQYKEGEESGEEEEALPMIQLASFALHKLFAEWECGGHKVPQLRALAPQISEEYEAEERPAPRAGRRPLPTNAAAMHPCMLLTHLRPDLQYRELPGDDALYAMAIDLDGVVYVGRAASKRDARKEAARAACAAHFGVKYDEAAPSSAPASTV